MQLNMFEDNTQKHDAIAFVTKELLRSEPRKKEMWSAIKENNRSHLIELLQESMKDRAFSYVDSYEFVLGTITIDGKEYKVTARDLADMALKIYEER